MDINELIGEPENNDVFSDSIINGVATGLNIDVTPEVDPLDHINAILDKHDSDVVIDTPDDTPDDTDTKYITNGYVELSDGTKVLESDLIDLLRTKDTPQNIPPAPVQSAPVIIPQIPEYESPFKDLYGQDEFNQTVDPVILKGLDEIAKSNFETRRLIEQQRLENEQLRNQSLLNENNTRLETAEENWGKQYGFSKQEVMDKFLNRPETIGTFQALVTNGKSIEESIAYALDITFKSTDEYVKKFAKKQLNEQSRQEKASVISSNQSKQQKSDSKKANIWDLPLEQRGAVLAQEFMDTLS